MYAINPGATEICNGLMMIVMVVSTKLCKTHIMPTLDNDGYGDAMTTMAWSPPSGYVADNTDCNDNNVLINPGATEICNGLMMIVMVVSMKVYKTLIMPMQTMIVMETPPVTTMACSPPSGYVTDNTDCNDNNVLLVNFSGSTEICNGLDDVVMVMVRRCKKRITPTPIMTDTDTRPQGMFHHQADMLPTIPTATIIMYWLIGASWDERSSRRRCTKHLLCRCRQ
ncbi:MAG: putative metal-binding motif-containing protein [Saprospiraceae bacterium]|nr:putative metal-binding motif-containing protein [Saprospiraceae bacterium]